MEGWLVFGFFLVVFVVLPFLGWINEKIGEMRSKAKKYDELKPRLDSLEAKESDLKNRQAEWEKKVKYDTEVINYLVAEKSQGFPWLAQAYADYFHLQDMKTANYLEYKSHPARKAAEHVREMAAQRRIAERLYRVLKYQLEYYENLFPWLVDFKGEDIDDLIRQTIERMQKGRGEIDESQDGVRTYTTEGERATLSRQELFQRALDRYWQKKKSKWEIGRDYERYVGYLHEKDGYDEYYQGIVEGLADLGRDVIAIKQNEHRVIQCKCWSQERTIHEKHIFQLFGTTVEYWLKNMESKQPFQPTLFPELLRSENMKPTFITSTKLSEKAKQFAEVLHVEVIEGFPFQHYPSIKCNVSRRSAEKIYHLPFDQQYDRTLVEEERNECYVETVKEAEALGFRRAFRWRGESSE